MEKINFQDLPSTETPINSTNLNKVQENVENVFDGNESMGSIVVEDIECKNLFDIRQAKTTNAIINSLTKDSIVFSDNGDVWSQLIYKLVLEKNTIYTLKYTFETTNANFSPYVDIQGNGQWYNSLGNGSTGTNVITFNSGEWDYIHISFPIGGETNITNTGTLSNVQLEKGSVATEYVPYKTFDITSLFKLVAVDFNMPTTSAEAKGYISQSVTIPDGYTSIGVDFFNGQVAASAGLQLTPINGHFNKTGTTTIYIHYYTPKAITTEAQQKITMYVLCIKTEAISI